MGYSCEIVADSANTLGNRITTFQITFPRCILAEYNSHRKCARNSASSRAIPVEKMLKMVEDDPYIPIFTRNQVGMQGIDASDDVDFQAKSTEAWLKAKDRAMESASDLLALGIHKQDANRLLEPFMWHTVITTATSWANFFTLRVHPLAHPAIQTIATMMADTMVASQPKLLQDSEWHLPYITFAEINLVIAYYDRSLNIDEAEKTLLKMSVARCARVSYLRQSVPSSIEKDIELHDRLVGADPKHSSAAEHQAMADPEVKSSGNFDGGWLQYRHTLPNESSKEFIWKGVIIK